MNDWASACGADDGFFVCVIPPVRPARDQRAPRTVKELTVSGKRTSLVHARSACSGVWNQPISHQIESSIHHVVNSRAVRRNHPDQPAGRGGCGRGRVESLQSAFSSPGLTTAAVDPKHVIDQVFDFAEKMLEVQREFAKNLASTAAAAGEATRQQAEARRRRCKTRPSSPGRRVSEALRRRPPTPT